MAYTLHDLDKLPNGAQFFTGDLHVHSHGGSPDVTDAAHTPEAIVDAAVQQEISVLAITDHNSTKNTERSIEYARKYSGQLLVLAGIEVTTANGHLLVYFAPEAPEKLHTFLGRLNIVAPGTHESHTSLSIADVVAEAGKLGGIAVAAHIDREKTGFEMLASGYPNWKKDLIGAAPLYGLEIDDPAHATWYSPDDESVGNGPERSKLMQKRKNARSTVSRAVFAHVRNSDAHSLAAFTSSRSARGLTRYKMDSLTFESFRTALLDPEARVRIVASLPPTVPRILGMIVTGGFLAGEQHRFSDNLNCYIGGRGTGKSTALKCLAYALGADDKLEGFDNCPDSVVVYCRDSHGVHYRYERMRGSAPSARAKEGTAAPIEVPVDSFTVEYYGQGDLAEVAKDPLQHAELLQAFMDKHIQLSDLQAREKETIDKLANNSAQLIPLETQAATRQGKKIEVDDLDKKMRLAEEGHLKEVAATQSKLSAEKTLANLIDEVGNKYAAGITLQSFKHDYAQLLGQVGELTGDVAAAAQFADAARVMAETNTMFEQHQRDILAAMRQAGGKLRGILEQLKVAHASVAASISTKVAALQKAGLSASVADFNKLMTRRATLAGEISRIDQQRSQRDELSSRRAELLKDLLAIRADVTQRRKEQVKRINIHLAETIRDYVVAIVYDEAGLTQEFLGHFSGIMEGSYMPSDLAKRICEATTPGALASLVDSADMAKLSAIAGMGQDWARKLTDRFRYLSRLHHLEAVGKPLKPTIRVVSKGAKAQQIPVNQLSDGQRHTILLTIAMLAGSQAPLIIDQPEDDLDNTFIFTSVVKNLRQIKERRQVFVVTHNANIAVLGDAEMIFPMRCTDESAKSFDFGSIDRQETKQAVQAVLEGGELAFRRRSEIYGHEL